MWPHTILFAPFNIDTRSNLLRSRYSRIVSEISRHVHTAILFTWTDYKTIFVPITAFACAVGPLHSFSNLLQAWAWIWIHLLLCNVSNQARSKDEDAVNRPWRPILAGRLTESQAYYLRWAIAAGCVLWSAVYGPDQVLTTLGLLLTTFVYDEGGASKHVIGKNFCNIGGYVTFEIGATKIIASQRNLDPVSTTAVIISGILIFTTIQAQDFPDVDGDAALGRMTFPIYAPEWSRIVTLGALISWSTFLCWYWSLGPVSSITFMLLGLYSGIRYYLWRRVPDDKTSYLVFSVWLTLAHLLPLRARIGMFAF
ncbi:UbiA prenyltransferase family-domain-containing protein [Mycena epipterygia]|nr:UbiA prenyltransferase family-domain-containing protein [Mycena epipterygia]